MLNFRFNCGIICFLALCASIIKIVVSGVLVWVKFPSMYKQEFGGISAICKYQSLWHQKNLRKYKVTCNFSSSRSIKVFQQVTEIIPLFVAVYKNMAGDRLRHQFLNTLYTAPKAKHERHILLKYIISCFSLLGHAERHHVYFANILRKTHLGLLELPFMRFLVCWTLTQSCFRFQQ